MNTYNFIPMLFDARFHGVYSFESVLAYHKSVENNMPVDGLVWLCENPKMDILFTRQESLVARINELEAGMEGQPYGVWTILDREAHMLRTRLQLVRLCISNYHKQACPVS